jgi:hypothetical protein
MKGKRGGLPPNVIRLCASRPGPPSKAAIISGAQLFKVFLTIESEGDRNKVLDLANQLASTDADAKT